MSQGANPSPEETYFTTSASENEEENAAVNEPQPLNGVPHQLPTGEPTLFNSTVMVDKSLKIGIALLATHESFGNLVLFINKADTTIVIREIQNFLYFIASYSSFLLGLIHEGRGIDDITYSVNEDYSYNFSQHPLDIRGQNTTITLSHAQMGRLHTEHLRSLNKFYEEYKNIYIVVNEAIKDVHTELRMYAQGYCDACKAYTRIVKGHTCVALPGHRLDRLLRSALRVGDKWPSSFAMNKIYERLSLHKAYFKQVFRNSMRRNQYVNDNYKVAALPNFVN